MPSTRRIGRCCRPQPSSAPASRRRSSRRSPASRRRSLEARLRSLVRRELLTLDADPRSPTRGQYGFVQALTHDVAYKSLGRRERRALHLATAREIEAAGDEELAGILASHFLAAYRALPEGPEGEAIVTQARLALARSRRTLGRAVRLGRRAALRRAGARDHDRSGRPRGAWRADRRVRAGARPLGARRGPDPRRDRLVSIPGRAGRASRERRSRWRGSSFDRWQIAEAVETLEAAIRDRDLSQPDPELAAVVAIARAWLHGTGSHPSRASSGRTGRSRSPSAPMPGGRWSMR